MTSPARHRDGLAAFMRDVLDLLVTLGVHAVATGPSGREYLRTHLHIDGDTHVHGFLTDVGFPYHTRKRREAHRLGTRLDHRIERLRAEPVSDPPEPVLRDPGLPDRQGTYLRRRGLLPIALDDHKIPLLARVLGYALGDGSLHEIDGQLRLTFAGEPEGLRDLADDLATLGVGTGLRRWDTKDMVELHVHSRAFARYLELLGMPRSPKVERVYGVPGWILRAPPGVKAEFLAGLFGADGWLTGSDGRYAIGLTQAKSAVYLGSLHLFMTEIGEMLEEVAGCRWGLNRERCYTTEDGKVRVTERLFICGREDVMRFLSDVGFAYSRAKAERTERALKALGGSVRGIRLKYREK